MSLYIFILKIYISILEVGLNLSSSQNATWVAFNILISWCILYLGPISDIPHGPSWGKLIVGLNFANSPCEEALQNPFRERGTLGVGNLLMWKQLRNGHHHGQNSPRTSQDKTQVYMCRRGGADRYSDGVNCSKFWWSKVIWWFGPWYVNSSPCRVFIWGN